MPKFQKKKEKLIENEKNVISFVLLHYCIVLSNKLISFAELLFNIFGKSSQVLVSVKKKIVQKVLYSMGIIAPIPPSRSICWFCFDWIPQGVPRSGGCPGCRVFI